MPLFNYYKVYGLIVLVTATFAVTVAVPFTMTAATAAFAVTVAMSFTMSAATAAFAVTVTMSFTMSAATAAFAVTVAVPFTMSAATAAFAVTMTMSFAMTAAATAFAVTVTMSFTMTAAATAFAVTVAMFFAMTAAAAAFAAIVATAAAALAAHHVDQTLYFRIGSIAHLHHVSLEMQVLTGQRVIQVNNHFVGLYFEHNALKTITVAVHQGQHGTGIYHIFVKMSVHAEHLFVKLYHVFIHVRAVSIVYFQLKVKSIAGSQCADFLFKRVERHTHAGDKLERMLSRSFLYQFVNTFFVVAIEFVCHGDILVGSLFHCVCIVCFLNFPSNLQGMPDRSDNSDLSDRSGRSDWGKRRNLPNKPPILMRHVQASSSPSSSRSITKASLRSSMWAYISRRVRTTRNPLFSDTLNVIVISSF